MVEHAAFLVGGIKCYSTERLEDRSAESLVTKRKDRCQNLRKVFNETREWQWMVVDLKFPLLRRRNLPIFDRVPSRASFLGLFIRETSWAARGNLRPINAARTFDYRLLTGHISFLSIRDSSWNRLSGNGSNFLGRGWRWNYREFYHCRNWDHHAGSDLLSQILTFNPKNSPATNTRDKAVISAGEVDHEIANSSAGLVINQPMFRSLEAVGSTGSSNEFTWLTDRRLGTHWSYSSRHECLYLSVHGCLCDAYIIAEIQ